MKKWPTEADLRRLCSLWQQMLRLQQWKITIRYAHTREMADESGHIAWGRCLLNANHLIAKILVLHPDDYEDDDGREDIETTIVHELMHLLMDGILRDVKVVDPAAEVAEEQAINVTSGLLVELHTALRALAGRRK